MIYLVHKVRPPHYTTTFLTKEAIAVESTNILFPGKEVTTSSPDSVIAQAVAVSSSPVSTVNQNLSSNPIHAGSCSSSSNDITINGKRKPKLDLEAIRAKVKRRRLEREANKLVVSDDDDLTKDILEREIESGIE